MNRKALILYIRDLRDLEIAARRIEKLYQEEKKDYEQVLDSLENGKFMSEIEEPIFGVLMGCGVCFLMGYFCNWLKKLVALQLWNYCFFGVAIFFWFMGIVFLFAVISGVLENSRKRDEAQKNNAREEKRIADNQELINQVKSNWKKKNSQHSLWKINRAGNSICFALKLKEKMLTFFCCCVWSLAWKLPFC